MTKRSFLPLNNNNSNQNNNNNQNKCFLFQGRQRNSFYISAFSRETVRLVLCACADVSSHVEARKQTEQPFNSSEDLQSGP